MKTLRILFSAAALIAAVSCNKELQDPQVNQESEITKTELIPMTFTATTTDTRTTLDGVSINWLSTDKISVFDGEGNRQFSTSGEGTTVQFSGEASQAGVYYAVYPYNKDAAFDGTNMTVTTELVANQTPTPGTFTDGLNINASKSSDNTTFHFTNVLSVAKFTLSESNLGGKTIKSVKFGSTYPLAGDVVITYGETITATAGSNTVNEITLANENGSALTDGTYYFVVLPNAGGPITMTFESTDGCTASISANLGKPFTAGVIKNLGTVGGLTWKEPIVENFNSSTVTSSSYSNNAAIIPTNMTGYDYTWTLSGATGTLFRYGVKLGSGSQSGEISSSNILSSIPAGSTFTVRVYAAVWDTDGGNLVVSYNNTELVKAPSTSISDPDNKSYSASDFGEPTEFVFTKTANDNVLYVGSSLKRILIDKIEIVDGGSITPIQTLTITPASDNPETVPSAGGVLNYTVTTENINTWSVDSNDDAFVPEKTAEGFKVTVAPNTDSTPRSATITVTGGDKTESVTINQAGLINGKPITFTVPETATFTGNGTSISLTYNNVTITQTMHGTTPIATEYNHSNTLRVYKSHELSFSSEYDIISVVLGHGNSFNGDEITANVGNINAEESQASWSGQAKNVVLTMGSQLRVTSITITYLIPNGTVIDPTLSIDDDFSLVVNQTKTLTVDTNSDGVISYSSNNPSVATVVDGVVTAIAPGTATITVNVAASEWFNAASKSVEVTVSSGGGDTGEPITLFHESFGNNPNKARAWDDSYSVKSGEASVYSGISSYDVVNVKQGKNTTGYTQSGLNQSSQGDDAIIIIGPLNVSDYNDLALVYQWKAASIGGTYYTKLYYATSKNGSFLEVTGTGNGATSFVERSYSLPAAAQVSTLYLKIIWNTSNTQAIIDEVDLSGKSTN